MFGKSVPKPGELFVVWTTAPSANYYSYIYIESSKVISPLCCVSSLQPGGVQSEHLPHLRGPDQSPESGPVLCLWRCVCDRLELPGCDRNRALPNSTTVEFPQALKTGLCLREEV